MDPLDVEAVELGDGVERRPQDLGVLRKLGYDAERGLEPSGHDRGQLRRRGRRAGLGGEVVAQGLVHLAQRLAEPGRLAGEVAAGVVGVHLRVGEQRADAGQRQVPAVAGRAQELLQHRELQRPPVVVDVEPAVERGDVLRAGLGQHLVHLDVGVHPGRDLAEHLHQRVLAEGDRGVGLLAAEQGRVRLEVELVARQRWNRSPPLSIGCSEALSKARCHSAIASRSCSAS